MPRCHVIDIFNRYCSRVITVNVCSAPHLAPASLYREFFHDKDCLTEHCRLIKKKKKKTIEKSLFAFIMIVGERDGEGSGSDLWLDSNPGPQIYYFNLWPWPAEPWNLYQPLMLVNPG